MKKILTSIIAFCVISSQSVIANPVCIKDSDIGKQLNLPIYEWVDASKRRKGVVVAVPGLTLYAYAWNDLATSLALKGYRVFSLDLRGFGRWRTESAKYNGNSKIEIGQSQQDLLDLLTTLRQANPGQKIFCLGESLGANMALLLVSEHAELANGAILGSLCHNPRIHPKLRMTVDLAKQLVEPNSPLNLTPYAAPYLTNNLSLARACNTDPNIYRTMTPVELVKVDMLNSRALAVAKTLPADYPLCVFAGLEDAMFKQPDLPKAVEKFGTRNVTLKLFPGKAHLLLEHQMPAPEILALIDTWMKHQFASDRLAISPQDYQQNVIKSKAKKQ